jgi:HSP20 family protein
MSIVRWEPFGSIENLFGRMPSLLRWPRLETNGETRFEWSPTADISETDKEYLIRAELPAVSKEDVRITVDNGMLTISGERKQREEEKKEKFHRVESFYGSFSRSFALPDNADADKILAESKDGIVTVHVPKMKIEQKKLTEIKVQ